MIEIKEFEFWQDIYDIYAFYFAERELEGIEYIPEIHEEVAKAIVDFDGIINSISTSDLFLKKLYLNLNDTIKLLRKISNNNDLSSINSMLHQVYDFFNIYISSYLELHLDLELNNESKIYI